MEFNFKRIKSKSHRELL